MCAVIRRARFGVLPLLLLAAAVVQAQPPVPVSLKISHEVAPPGAITQVKVFVTEPKPITTGRMRASFDAFSGIEGIALAAEDAAAIAVVRGTQVALSIVSPTASFAADPDYPVLTIAGRINAAAQAGKRFPIGFAPGALELVDPGGTVYPFEVKDGSVTAGGTLSLGDVIPGDADLPAGAVVTLFGTGFDLDTKVRLKDVLHEPALLVSPSRLDVVLAQPARMRSRSIRVKTRAAESQYFSYQRHYRAGTSAHEVLRDVVPVFAAATAALQSIAAAGSLAGIALQNPGEADIFVRAELLDASGASLATSTVDVPSQKYVVLAVSEVFGALDPNWHPAAIRLTSPAPIQALGVDVDDLGNTSPRLPQ